jgi:hypothetical protein
MLLLAASPFAGNWTVALKAFLPLIEWGFAFILFFVIVWLIAIRLMVQGKIHATFHGFRKKAGGLFKLDQDHNCIWLPGKGDKKRDKYNIDDDCIEEIEFPGIGPKIFNTTVRSLDFDIHNPNPRRGKGQSKTTAHTNKLTTDENVLAAVYQFAQKGLGLKPAGGSMLTMLLLVGILLFSLLGAWMSMSANSAAKANTTQIQTIQKALNIK